MDLIVHMAGLVRMLVLIKNNVSTTGCFHSLFSTVAAGVLWLLVSTVVLTANVHAHPETAEGSCHFHTDSGEQHCSPDRQREPVESTPAVVQPLVKDEPSADQGEDPSVVDQFEKLEQQMQLIAEIQGGLARLGYRPGPPTGMMNRATEAAIRKFQTDNLLPPSGQPSLSLLTIIEDEVSIRTQRQ